MPSNMCIWASVHLILCIYMLCVKFGLGQSSNCPHKVQIRALYRQSLDCPSGHPHTANVVHVYSVHLLACVRKAFKKAMKNLPIGKESQKQGTTCILELLYLSLYIPCTSSFSDISCIQ